MGKHIIICSTCRKKNDTNAPSSGLNIASALNEFDPRWQVQVHPCLSMCKHPTSLAIKASGKATYLFSNLTLADISDLKVFLTLYDKHSDGWIEDARPLGRLRFCLHGRIPATPE